MTDYCDVKFTWMSDKSTDLLVHYSVLNDTRPISNSESTENYCTNRVKLSKSEDEDCELTITCKSLYKVAISEIYIVSEARVLELYDYTEGYIDSQKGLPIPSEHKNDGQLYKISFTFDSPIRRFYAKLKSLPNKDSVIVNLVNISLTACDDNVYSAIQTESINIPKLKHFVADLGDQVPENARSLLEAMEQYQKNKAVTVDDIKKQLCQETTGQDQSLAGMSKMMAMFSQLNSHSNSTPSTSQDALFSMISSVQNGNKSDSADMYKFLKTICGQVTEMRQPLTPTISQEFVESIDQSQASGAASNSTATDSKMEDKLKELEQQVLTKVDKKIDALEQRLSSKLDLILQGLNLQTKSKEMDLD